MTRIDARVPAAALALLLLAAVAVALVVRSAQVIEATGRGADPATALRAVPPAGAVTGTTVTWRPDAVDTGRRMEPATRRALADDLVRGWLQLATATTTGDAQGLDTYVTGPALDGVTPGLNVSGVAAMELREVELHLRTYSADGQVVAIEEVATVHRRMEAGGLVLPTTTTETSDLVLILRDGTWRVHHRVLRDLRPAG